jgi:hypothetical protein
MSKKKSLEERGHGYSAYVKDKCRCPICREAAMEKQRQYREAKRNGHPPKTQRKKAVHGTVHMYSKYKCRCPRCKKAKAKYMAEYKDRFDIIRVRRDGSELLGRKTPEHGTRARYESKKYRCRCPRCKKAKADYERKWRETIDVIKIPKEGELYDPDLAP